MDASHKRSSIESRDWLSLAPALAAALLYATTMCRSIWIGDSAEFALALHSTGVAHPPGYPLFTMIGTIAVSVLGSLRPIVAGGVCNVLIAAAAVGVVYLIAMRFHTPLQALGLALVWAASPIFWAETAGVEIYTLNVLLVGMVLLGAFAKPHNRWLLIAYLFGLSLTNHPLALALAPGLLYLFIAEKQFRRPGKIIPMAMLVAIAGSAYFYLWAASVNDPVSDWGNPESLSALWAHMRLEQYAGWVDNSIHNLWFAAKLYFRAIVDCYTYAGVVLVITGVLSGLKQLRRGTIFLLIVLAAALALASFHQAVNHEPFFLVPMLATLLLIGFNLVWLKSNTVAGKVTGIGLIATAAIMAIVQYDVQDKSDYILYEDYSRGLLDALPQNSTAFLAGDINAFGPLYLHYAENYRPDLTLYDRSIRKRDLLARAQSLGGQAEDILAARNWVLHLERGRKFLAKSHYQNEPEWWGGLDSLHSYGLYYEFASPLDQAQTVQHYPPEYDPGDLMSRELLANVDLIRGEEALLAKPPNRAEALEAFGSAMRRYDKEDRGILFNQLGIFFRRLGFEDLAMRSYEEGLNKPILAQQNRKEILFNISNVHKARANEAIGRGDYEEAIRHSLLAIELDRSNEHLLLNIALIYERELREPAAAIPYYERYLEVNPNDDRVRRALDALKSSRH